MHIRRWADAPYFQVQTISILYLKLTSSSSSCESLKIDV